MATRTTRSSESTQRKRKWQFLRFNQGVNYRQVNRALLNRLNRLGQALGQTITITSGFRTYQEQAGLYNKYQHGGNIAARPGHSQHEKGLAVDAVVNGQALSSVVKASVLRRYGLAAPVQGDPVHIQLLSGGSSAGGGGTTFQQFVNEHQALKPYASMIRHAALNNGIDPLHYAALIYFESGGNPKARSYADAVGLVQIHLPSHPNISKAQAEDPAFAIAWGARFFAAQVKKFGGYDAAYRKGYNPGYNGPGPFDNLDSPDYTGGGYSGGGGGGQAPAGPQTIVYGLGQSSAAGEGAPPNAPPMTAPPMPGVSGSEIQAPFPDDLSDPWKQIAALPFASDETRKFAGLG